MPPKTAETFELFRQEIDESNDRRERLIKASRDVTNISKKAIFLLHRIILEDTDDDRGRRAAVKGRSKLDEARPYFAAMRLELVGDRFWRHQRQVSPAVQEYIEALSFAHYLEHGSIIPFNDTQAAFSDADGLYFPLTVSDYLLGLSDLTGELMRFAISNISRRGGSTTANDICRLVRDCKAGQFPHFEQFIPHIRDLGKKQSVTSSSLEKIEAAAYAVMVRGSEFDLPPEILEDLIQQTTVRFDIGRRDDSLYNNGS
ncbi:Translin-associated protein X [Mycena indigotica]|uniref:Translin-associated protein X n=1 Tax=Mycena indigotica TaxID=2126181 RepID=A0A8H6W6F8_9AGAR|nr:Translin-associated protein X [Mycena indigotica]KAF7306632.1 Translin-associated protein X [Mycena indigotica]